MPEYGHGRFNQAGLSKGVKYGIGSRGANKARRFGGRKAVIFLPTNVLCSQAKSNSASVEKKVE